MVKCPFCGFGNEEGALFCEQCKSDISGVMPAAPAPEEVPVAVVEALPEAPVMAAIVEEPVVAEVMPAEAPPKVEEVVEAAPMAEAAPEAAPATLKAVETPPPPPAPPASAPAPAPAAAAAAAAAPAPAATAPKAAPAPIPTGAQPKLLVQRGLKINEEYNIFAGENYIGRADEKPVDIDLTFQEPEDRVWVSRQHALVVFDDATGLLTVEDLNSANGTFVNRERVYPGQPKQLSVGSTVQIGTVHMRVKL